MLTHLLVKGRRRRKRVAAADLVVNPPALLRVFEQLLGRVIKTVVLHAQPFQLAVALRLERCPDEPSSLRSQMVVVQQRLRTMAVVGERLSSGGSRRW